jgi:hypothetical protein
LKEFDEIPFPISFNPLKHHLGEIIQFIRESSDQELHTMINSINHNNIDIYSGDYNVREICEAVLARIKEIGFLEREKYISWLGKKNGHQYISLNDESIWILLRGDDDKRYIHIHPAKFGPYSIRYKGTTLKTVYKLLSSFKHSGFMPDLDTVNQARIGIGLSPVKRLTAGNGILKCWKEFSSI